MTIKFESLSGHDQETVKTIWSDMMSTLEAPANLNQRITTWFGAGCPAQFRTSMPRVLRKLKSCMNLCTVTLMCCPLEDRDVDTYGAAYHNINGGFADIINFDPATQPDLLLEIDSKWNIGLEMFRTPVNRDSAFQTIAHELSHLLMATQDEPADGGGRCYGEAICLHLAANDDARARTNADNWGYFIEDLRA